MTTLSGAFSMVLVYIINQVCEQTMRGESGQTRYFLFYLLAFAIYFLASKSALSEAHCVVNDGLYELRVNFFDRVRRLELKSQERLGEGMLFARFSRATRNLAEIFPALVSTVQSTTLLAFGCLYLFFLSPGTTLVLGIFLKLFIAYMLLDRSKRRQLEEDITAAQGDIFDKLRDFTAGYKELRLNEAKSESLFQSFSSAGVRYQNLSRGAGHGWVHTILLVSLVQYLVLGLLLFIIPSIQPQLAEKSLQITMVILVCFNPAINLVAITPLLTQVSVGLEQLRKLESELEKNETVLEPAPECDFSDFQEIVFDDLVFFYPDRVGGQPGFQSGPWDFTLKRGERIFFVGGNGSGKSTAVKLLTGLYPAAQGEILVDGRSVDSSTRPNFRSLFSAVFADYHLFERVYGEPDSARVQSLLKRMELETKVSYTDGRFSTTKLSTGQRKRLALIIALLEDRPIYVFDEWAADQDGSFREEFYERILEELRREGKTVIAVTHDDRYWHLADRVVKFDFGRIVQTT